MYLTVIIPTYNEAQNVAILINKIFEVLLQNGLDGEVIVVDDDSPDRTWEIAQQLQSSHDNLNVLRRPHKRGLTSAVLDGIALARGEIIGVIDGDLSHPAEKIPELIKPILHGEADLVVGSRYVKGGYIENWTLKRRFLSTLATLVVRGLTPIKDPMSGFFFFRKEVIEGVKLSPNGSKIGLDILVKGNFKHAAEVPIQFGNRQYGKSKLSVGVIMASLFQVLRLYLYRLCSF